MLLRANGFRSITYIMTPRKVLRCRYQLFPESCLVTTALIPLGSAVPMMNWSLTHSTSFGPAPWSWKSKRWTSLATRMYISAQARLGSSNVSWYWTEEWCCKRCRQVIQKCCHGYRHHEVDLLHTKAAPSASRKRPKRFFRHFCRAEPTLRVERFRIWIHAFIVMHMKDYSIVSTREKESTFTHAVTRFTYLSYQPESQPGLSIAHKTDRDRAPRAPDEWQARGSTAAPRE